MQQRPRRLCDRRAYIIYVGLQCAAAITVRKTDSQRSSSSVSVPRQDRSRRSDSVWLSAGAARVEDHLQPSGPRMVRLNWSPCGGSPPVVFSLHSLSSPPPDPLGSKHHYQDEGNKKHHTSGSQFQIKLPPQTDNVQFSLKVQVCRIQSHTQFVIQVAKIIK